MTNQPENIDKGFYKLSWLERIAFGSGDMAQNFIYQTVTTYLLFFYTNVYGLNPAFAAAMFLGVRIIDAIWDPVLGALVDMSSTRFGKYRGWMLIMALPLTALMILCFVVPDFSKTGKEVYACITYVALSIVYTTVNVPFGALNAALTRDQQEITILTTVRMWLVNVAQVAITYGVPTIVIAFSGTMDTPEARGGWLSTIIIYGVVGFGALLFSFSGTKERVLISKEDAAKVRITDLFTELKNNPPLVILSLIFITAFGIMAIGNSAGTYFIKYNIGNENWVGLFNVISALPALLILPFIPWLRKKLGKKRLLYFSLVVSFIGYAGLFVLPASNITIIFMAQTVRSIGFCIAGAFIWSLIPEAITYGEWKSGKRISGIANALIGFFFKFGLALGGFVPGMVLAQSGFNADIPIQSDAALLGIRLILGAIPGTLVLVLMFIVSKYNLTDTQLITYGEEIETRNRNKNHINHHS
ncbi:MAG: MFS transporter [Tannerellaceae bacterium]|jgi:GPH family glycoside/pentoside/hexuronide:cation symporter|nr:MFS transporter [Tannerellaceae bacterium]